MLLRQLAASLTRTQHAHTGIGALVLQQADSIANAAAACSCHASTTPGHASTSYLATENAANQRQAWRHNHSHMQAMQHWPPQQHDRLLCRAYSAAARDPHALRSIRDQADSAADGTAPVRRYNQHGSAARNASSAGSSSSSSRSSRHEAFSADPGKPPKKRRDKYDPAFPKKKFKKAAAGTKELSKQAARIAWQLQAPPPQPDLQAWRKEQLPPDASFAEHVRAEAAAQKAKLSGKFGTMPTRLLLQLLQQGVTEGRQPTSQELYAEARAAFPGAFKSRVHFKRVLQVLQDNKWVGFHRPQDATTNKKVPFTLYITKLGMEQPFNSPPSRLLSAALPALDRLVEDAQAAAPPRPLLFQQA